MIELQVQIVEAVDEVVEFVSDSAGVCLAFGDSDGHADGFAAVADQLDVALTGGHLDGVAASEELRQVNL